MGKKRSGKKASAAARRKGLNTAGNPPLAGSSPIKTAKDTSELQTARKQHVAPSKDGVHQKPMPQEQKPQDALQQSPAPEQPRKENKVTTIVKSGSRVHLHTVAPKNLIEYKTVHVQQVAPPRQIVLLSARQVDPPKQAATASNVVVTTHLSDGLGNRLFQVAFGFAMARKHKDVTYKLVKALSQRNTHSGTCYLDTVLAAFPRDDSLETKRWAQVGEPAGRNLWYNAFDKPPANTVYAGYFQNDRYLSHCADEIRALLHEAPMARRRMPELAKKYPALVVPLVTASAGARKASNHDTIFLHVRRGDYVGHAALYVDLRAYFARAWTDLTKTHSNDGKDLHVAVISNDIKGAEANELNAEWYKTIPNKFYINENEVDTLYAMWMCNLGGICSNSTFSWWGAWGNRHMTTKRMYFPDQWTSATYMNKWPCDIWPTGSIKVSVAAFATTAGASKDDRIPHVVVD
jgi:hypothetical protein